MSSDNSKPLPILDKVFVISNKSPTKHFTLLRQCVDRANEMLRVTNSKGQNSFILSALVPLFHRVGSALALEDSTFQNKVLCHDILLHCISKLGEIAVEAGGTSEYGQVDADNGTIVLNLLWIGSAEGCEDEDVLGYHKALCITKLLHHLANLLTSHIMTWMREKQGNMSPTLKDLFTPKEIGTRLTVSEETVTVNVPLLSAPVEQPHVTGTGISAHFTSVPALKRTVVTVGDMGFGLEEVLLGGYRLDMRPVEKAKWQPDSLIFTSTQGKVHEMSSMQLKTWVTHVLNSRLSRRSQMEDFVAWYAPPRAASVRLQRLPRRT